MYPSLFGRSKLREVATQFELASYAPQLKLHGLIAGIDNLRPDLALSSKFAAVARAHLAQLIEQHGDVQQLVRMPEKMFVGAAYARAGTKRPPAEAQTDSPARLQSCLAELQLESLRQARAADEVQIDLLWRVGVLKFLRAELAAQFSEVMERCRESLKNGDERRRELHSIALRDCFLRFQINKRQVLRRVSQDLLATLQQIERETAASTRQSLFGDHEDPGYEVLNNRLLFADSCQDPFVRADNYALFGTYDGDPDRFDRLAAVAKDFLRSLGLARSDNEAEEQLNVPDNAKMLMYSGLAEDSPRGRAQRSVTAAWVEALEDAKVMDYAIAAYEAVPILRDYGAVISPQQLKCALIMKSELRRVEELLESYDRFPLEKLHAAVQRVRAASRADRLRYAARYLIDIARLHRDMQKMQVLERAMEGVNVLTNERLRELSKVNGTLYEVLLPEEQQRSEQRADHHVVLKADIRDSSFVTRSLMERGLNPASFFSLNFFEPVNTLLPLYGAEKVFIEGDAVILSVQENETQRGYPVARTCVMARSILQVVQAYNTASTSKGLPPLEVGIGIAYQNSAPLYLMDGMHRIMISDALNASDRLSACNKRARQWIKQRNPLFNVFVFQTGERQAASPPPPGVAEAGDDTLLNYNIGGIHLPRAAFQKLQSEISLEEFNQEFPMPWGPASVRLFRGLVPLRSGVFRPLLLREGRAAQVDSRGGFRFLRWTDHLYYEVCVNPELLAGFEKV
jgi:hypothetical protein